MFILEDDYGYIADNTDKSFLAESTLFQLSFWIINTIALFVSVSTVFSIFGRKILDGARLRFSKNKDMYIICGSNENAITFGQNLAYHDDDLKKPDRKRLIVFLDEEFSETIEKNIESINAIAITYGNEDFTTALKKTYITLGDRKIKLFAMHQDDGRNYSLIKQAVIYASSKQLMPAYLSLYVITTHLWIGDKLDCLCNENGGYQLATFNSAELATRKLIMSMPPYEAINFNNGIAEKDFTAMILGFGFLGKQVLRRLIMNSQFVGSNSRTIIVDKNIETIFNRFIEDYPGLAASYALELQDIDVESNGLFKLLNATISQIDYVVVCLGNEITNMEIASQIRHYCNKRALGKTPRIAVAVGNQALADSEDKDFTYFAVNNQLFTENIIVHEKLDKTAMDIAGIYSNCNTATEKEQIWEQSNFFTRESNRASADFLSCLKYLSENGASTETLAMTEHLRWNAFHYAMGYEKMELEEMIEYLHMLKNSGATENELKNCRKNDLKQLHICLVSWDELDELSQKYNSALADVGIETQRDFKQNDRDSLKLILN